jgi:phospholipase C
MDRRQFLKTAAAGVGAAALARPANALVNIATPVSSRLLPHATKTDVKTIVVLMMENRSVDHYLGWYGAEVAARPGRERFDGRLKASYLDRREGSPTAGQKLSTESWGSGGRNSFHGRGFRDPSHNINGGRAQANVTPAAPGTRTRYKMDGWLAANSGTDEFALSWYGPDDIPVWAEIVREFGTYDRYFCSFLGNTQPNRWYLASAQTGGEVYNTIPPTRSDKYPEWTLGYDWPTIYTLLDAAGVSWASYFCNLPNNAFWGPRHVHSTRHISEYYASAATGSLPQVVFIEPWFSAPEQLANDDHPHADIRLGQEFLYDVTDAWLSSPQFGDGAMFITYDEWGGFWDHVSPPVLADSQDDPSWERYRPPALDAGDNFTNGFGQLGMRVPTAVLSPWHTGGVIDHGTYDHVSILKFIGENFGLPVRTLNPKRLDATLSIERSFDFSRPKNLEVGLEVYEPPQEARSLPVEGSSIAGDNPLFTMRDQGWFDRLGLRVDYRFEDSYRSSAPRASMLSRT